MKHSITIQRLCLFLLVFLLAAPAWSNSETWKARDRKKYEVEGTRTTRDGIVAVTWSDCKTGPAVLAANRNWEMKKGSTVTITCKDGWRVRRFSIRGQLKNPEDIKSVNNNAYKTRVNEDNKDQVDINCWEAYSQSITIKALRDVEFAEYEVIYVKSANVRFEEKDYYLYSMSGWFTPKLFSDGHNGRIKYELDNNNVIATLLTEGVLDIKRPGDANFHATYLATGKYAELMAVTTIHVIRDRVRFFKKNDVNLISCGDDYGIFGLFDHNTSSLRSYKVDNGGFSVTSSNPNVTYLDGRVKCGSKAGEATITIKQAQNDYYEAANCSKTFYVIRRDRDGTMLIKDADEWKLFCKIVNEKGITNLNARLDGDVNLGSDIAMVGVGEHKYSGTFDGQNHTLTLGWDGGDGWMAPFHTMNGATIKNLRVNGYIKSKGKGLSGLILNVYGNTTVSGCTSEVDITSGSSDGGCASAGMIQYISSDAHVSINDCLVKGTLKATTEIGTKGMAGFVYDQRGNCTLTNCLYTGTNNAAGGYTFAYKSTIKNCYYLNACAATYGEKVTIDQLKSGEVAYKLQAGRDTQMWGQTLGTDNEPLPTGNGTKRVHKVDFTYNDQVKATRYATHGNAIYGSLPATAKEIMGSDYNEHHYYTGISFEGFSASTTVNSDRTVRVIINKNDYYAIASKENWKEFCNLVNGGQTKLDAKMTQNVNLGSDITMAGTYANKYAGTFDGGEHTLKINWNSGSETWIAPFYTVDGATVRNLRVEGDIKSSTHFLSGLICNVYGTTTISGCVSAVNITSSYNEGGCDAAGMIECVRDNANVTITDCVVKGKFHAATEKGKRYMAGFVCNQYGTCTLTNCLYVGENNGTGVNTHTFGYKTTLNNCYYLNACGTAQGKQVTKEQLKNGDVARLLQSNRNTQFWGQELGKENEPLPTAEEAKKVYNIDFVYKGKVKASRYANPGKAIFGGMPTFIAKDIMDSEYNEHHYYTFAFGNNFNASVLIYYDRTVDINPTEKDYYEIASKDNWIEFCYIVSSGQNAVDAKMTKDVDLGSDIFMVGDSYAGTFDGQNHTLKINWNNTSGWLAPFYTVDGATIKNLRTEGEIKSSSHFLSGLVQSAYGNTTISGCVSAVNITSSYDNGGCNAAGMVECVRDNANVTITDCLVKGKIDATTEKGKESMGGFVNNQYGKCTLINCLYAGENNGTRWSRTFAPYSGSTLTNCYYLNACGDAQGKKVTKEQLKSGEVAYLLQNKRDANIWGQELGKENDPQPTDDAAKHIYKVDFSYNGKVAAARYANRGKHIFGELPKEKEILGAAYDPNNTYALAFEDDFSASTTVDRDRTVVVTVIENNYFEIATKEDWKKFCGLVKKGQQNLNAKMTKDVDLGTEIVMAGEENLEYSGTFDGQGHTLKIDWDGGYTAWISPFLYVKDATIQNLRTKGQITAGRFGFSGLICKAYGNNTISSCISDVDINGAADLAGMVKAVGDNSSVTFNDCIVKGRLNATNENGIQDMGGFVYFQSENTTCIFNNCLYLGTNNAVGWAKTFASNPTLTNCYYLNACGDAQGMKVTEEQLKNGYVAYKLQNDRTDKCYWAQQLGDMLDFYNAADKGKTNYVYYDATNKRWTCDDFRLTDGTPLSIGLDFTAAKATYDRPFSSTNNATLCLPYELPRNGSFKAYNLSGGSNTSINFKETKDKLEAYRPYYITANGTPQLDGYNLQVKAYKADALKQPAGAFSFVGTVVGVSNATAAADNAYVLQPDGKFHKVTTENPGSTVPAYRAYITCPKTLGAKQLSVILEGETTGIDGVTNDATDGPVYDLQGRRVADRLDDAARHQLPAGVYIVGGRKVIVK